MKYYGCTFNRGNYICPICNKEIVLYNDKYNNKFYWYDCISGNFHFRINFDIDGETILLQYIIDKYIISIYANSLVLCTLNPYVEIFSTKSIFPESLKYDDLKNLLYRLLNLSIYS